MDNYPMGAAMDAMAPWNEPMDEDVDVTFSQTLVKETVVVREAGSDDDVMELFRQQQRTALEVIGCCDTIVRQLLKEGRRWVAGIDLASLKMDCSDWGEGG